MERKRRKSWSTCPSCGEPSPGAYCSSCGQRNLDYRVSARALAAEALSEAFSVDSRIVRTIGPFFFRPGFLSTEFNAGRRAAYSSPLRMYLLGSLLLFGAYSLRPTSAAEVRVSVDEGLTVGFQFSDTPDASVEGSPIVSTAEGILVTDRLGEGADSGGASSLPSDAAVADPSDSGHHAKRFGVPSLDSRFEEFEAMAKRAPHATQRQLKSGMLSSLPKLMVLLVPVFALFLKLLYWRQRMFFAEHLVFAAHEHAFAFIVLALPAVLGKFWLLPVMAIGVHLIVGVRRVYRQSWPWTLLKCGALGFLYATVLTVTFAAAVVIAALTIESSG